MSIYFAVTNRQLLNVSSLLAPGKLHIIADSNNDEYWIM